MSRNFYSDRKIGREHIAFFRGWLQGMDLAVLADQYLDEGTDLRVAKSTVTWLQGAFCNAALRHGKHQEARLLRLHLRHVVADLAQESHGGQGASAPMSLEAFQEQEDPDGFYTERELIELYTQAFPETVDTRRQKRRSLIERQMTALTWLEPLIKSTPVRGDFVSAWFGESLARRLLLSEIDTIDHIFARMDELGYHWYKSVDGLGEKGAKRLVGWLRSYESELGSVPAHCLSKPRSAATQLAVLEQQVPKFDIVPLESFQAPVELSGFGGSNRLAGAASIDARSDKEAINAWINARAGSQNTARTYRKEAERLLLWAAIERGKALSDLSVEDCTAYRDWLGMLGRTPDSIWPYRIAQERWIAQRSYARTDKRWRPFEGSLSLNSVKQTLVIVRSMFQWLVQVRYCLFNPWDAVNKKPLVQQNADLGDVELTRVLSGKQWAYFMDVVEGMDEGAERIRLVAVTSLAYTTGMRISELVDARVKHLYSKFSDNELGQRWMLKVLGKGGRLRVVPIADEVMGALKAYLTYRGHAATIGDVDPETPLIAHLTKDNEPLSVRGMTWVMRKAFDLAAERMREDGHFEDANHIEKATTHWLRHSRGSHLANSGFPVALIQKLLGHQSLTTTSIYTSSSEEVLYRALVAHDGAGKSSSVSP